MRKNSITQAICKGFPATALLMSLLSLQASARESQADETTKACSRSGENLLFVGNRSMMLSDPKGGGHAKLHGGATDIGYTHGESYYYVENGPVAIHGIRLTYANYALSPDESSVPVGNPIAVEAAISVGRGHPIRVTFAKEKVERVIIGSEGEIVSNTIQVDIPPRAVFAIRTGVYVKPGETWPVGYSNYHRGDNAVASNDQTSRVLSDKIGISVPHGGAGGMQGYGPVSIVGNYEQPDLVVASLGDSLTTGNTGAGSGNGFGDRGTLPYGYASVSSGRIAYSKLARDSAYLKSFSLVSRTGHRLHQLDYATHVVVWLGTNDVGANSVDVLKAHLLALWQEAHKNGRKVVAVTLPPRTAKSSSGVSLEPRPGWEPGGKRDQLNAWIKSQLGRSIDYLLDFNPIWENATRPGTWNVGLSSDGTHPNETGMQAVRTIVASAGARWRSDYKSQIKRSGMRSSTCLPI
jgi:lysophospholipase L1-like esterase